MEQNGFKTQLAIANITILTTILPKGDDITRLSLDHNEVKKDNILMQWATNSLCHLSIDKLLTRRRCNKVISIAFTFTMNQYNNNVKLIRASSFFEMRLITVTYRSEMHYAVQQMQDEQWSFMSID